MTLIRASPRTVVNGEGCHVHTTSAPDWLFDLSALFVVCDITFFLLTIYLFINVFNMINMSTLQNQRQENLHFQHFRKA